MLPERDPLRRPVGHEDLADDVVPRHRPPHARVARLGAVVAHYEVVTGGHAVRLLRADVASVVLDVWLVEAPPVDVDVRRAALQAYLHALPGKPDDPLDEGAPRPAPLLRGRRRVEDDH